MKNEINHALQELGRAFDAGAGPIPLERLVALHLSVFRDFRARGLTWDQISRLLVRAGVVRPDGRPFGAAHLRGIFARQLHRNRRLARSIAEPARILDPGHAGEKTKQMPSRSSRSTQAKRRRSPRDHMVDHQWRQDQAGTESSAGSSDEQKDRPSARATGGDVPLKDALRRAAAARKTRR